MYKILKPPYGERAARVGCGAAFGAGASAAIATALAMTPVGIASVAAGGAILGTYAALRALGGSGGNGNSNPRIR